MKIRLADYVADFMADHGVRDCFSVVGGGAMHLNDALGHHDRIRCTYQHHEQACAIAAEAYARLEQKIALVCVTTGPGGINALTGVAGGWLDSIPMFIVSGQVRYDTTARYEKKLNGARVRAVGDQEFDITTCAQSMCKYAAMLERPEDIRYLLEKAWYLAGHGRPGPVWIDIPVNFQGMMIETENLSGYFESDDWDPDEIPKVRESVIKEIADRIRAAKRPVFYAGYGIRLAGATEIFRKVISQLGVPVVTYWNSVDLIENENPLYVGRGGNMGDRAGNFAVQNADLILAVGTRISIRQVGYNWQTWAREAKVIMVDIDPEEMKKHTIHVDLPVCADAKDFLNCLDRYLHKEAKALPLFSTDEGVAWRQICQNWKRDYPVTLPKHWEEKPGSANVFAFIKYLSDRLPEESLTAVSNGACCVVGHQNYTIKSGTRFIINSAIASMGYGLPAAIGLCRSAGDKETICLEGDGSIMMNLQELQTIITNRLPIKIFLINNQGYHSIRITQNNLFSDRKKVGIGPESGDLGFPDFEKLAQAFGYPYYQARSNRQMKQVVDKVVSGKGFAFCEIFTDTTQVWEPKNSARKRKDGTLVSPPLEDLAPFLPREELRKNMYISMIEDEEDERE